MPLPGAPPSPSLAPWLEVGNVRLAGRILAGYQRAFGRPLLAAAARDISPCSLAQELFRADTVVLAHNGLADPQLTYANAAALALWQRPWSVMVGLPSRLTAEPQERASRAQALAAALQHEAIAHYSGVRIDSRGRRFRIHGARLWTLRDGQGQPCGQAAAFDQWWWL